MGSALNSVGGPPPAPNPTPQATQPSAMSMAASPMAPGAPSSAPSQQQPAPQPPPPPSHAQTVAALRHFTAIETETKKLLKNPDCGKSNMHSAIIDGMTSLVARGIMTAPEAVKQLGQVPDKPFDQKKWLENAFAQAVQGQTAILALHQHGVMNGMPNDQTSPSPDDHQQHISGLMSQFKGGANG